MENPFTDNNDFLDYCGTYVGTKFNYSLCRSPVESFIENNYPTLEQKAGFDIFFLWYEGANSIEFTKVYPEGTDSEKLKGFIAKKNEIDLQVSFMAEMCRHEKLAWIEANYIFLTKFFEKKIRMQSKLVRLDRYFFTPAGKSTRLAATAAAAILLMLTISESTTPLKQKAAFTQNYQVKAVHENQVLYDINSILSPVDIVNHVGNLINYQNNTNNNW